MPDDELRRARNKCYRLLAYRARTVYELKCRLEQDGFAPPVIESVLARLREQKLLDDHAFADNWVRSRLAAKPVGVAYLRAELRHKGVDGEIIDDVLADYDEESEYQAAMRLLDTKLGCGDTAVKWRRVAGLLSRRGFSGAVINRVYRTVTEEGRFDIS